MVYRLERDETLPEGIRRIAAGQLDKLLEDLALEDRDEAVHEARKRFKKLRALARLVRDATGSKAYRTANRSFRDAARQLSGVRDQAVQVATLEGLLEHYDDELDRHGFEPLRERLIEAHRRARTRLLARDDALQKVAATVTGLRRRPDLWPLEQDSFKAIGPGLERVYRRGRQGLARAYAQPSAGNFHEWRKRAKYLRYQIDILSPLWPALLEPWEDALHDLTDRLGDEHDLAMLAALLERQPGLCPEVPRRQVLLGLIQRRRQELQAAARPLGEKLYTETPGRLVARLKAYWRVWREQG